LFHNFQSTYKQKFTPNLTNVFWTFWVLYRFFFDFSRNYFFCIFRFQKMLIRCIKRDESSFLFFIFVLFFDFAFANFTLIRVTAPEATDSIDVCAAFNGTVNIYLFYHLVENTTPTIFIFQPFSSNLQILSNYFPEIYNHFAAIYNYFQQFPTMSSNLQPFSSNYFPAISNHFAAISNYVQQFTTIFEQFSTIFQQFLTIFQQFPTIF